MIPDDLARELCDWLTDWAVGEPTHFITAGEAEELTGYLAPAIAKHLDQLAPPRDCCPSRRGQMHQNCKALSDALSEEAPHMSTDKTIRYDLTESPGVGVQVDLPRQAVGRRLFVDADGYVWWDNQDGTISMASTNPANTPTPRPWTYYAPENCPGHEEASA